MRNKISEKRNLGEKIRKLGKEKFSYKEIQAKLQCSKSTISYHLGKGQKEKCINRVKAYRETKPRDFYDHRNEKNN